MMFDSVLLKSLRDQRRALLGWSAGILLLIAAMGALWPSIRDMPDLSQFVANYPEPMRELFDLDAFGTGVGYMNSEVFGTMLPVLFIIFAIGRGARLVAGEEEAGTLDVLLVTRLTPARLVVEQAASLAGSLALLGTVVFGSTMLMSAVFDLRLDPADVASAVLAVVLLGLEYGWLALAVGAATGRRGIAIAAATVAAVAGYVLYLAGVMVDPLEPWLPLSPFHQALSAGPLGGGVRAAFAWLPVAGALCIAVALPLFTRRDIAAR